jgi:hypothetical protein
VGCYSIWEVMDTKVISLPYISINLQITNVFTKSTTR